MRLAVKHAHRQLYLIKQSQAETYRYRIRHHRVYTRLNVLLIDRSNVLQHSRAPASPECVVLLTSMASQADRIGVLTARRSAD